MKSKASFPPRLNPKAYFPEAAAVSYHNNLRHFTFSSRLTSLEWYLLTSSMMGGWFLIPPLPLLPPNFLLFYL